MKTRSKTLRRAAALLGVLVLGSAAFAMGGARWQSQAVSVNPVPICADDQYLVYRSTNVVCETLSPMKVEIPNCKSQGKFVSVKKSGGVVTLSCVDAPVCDAN